MTAVLVDSRKWNREWFYISWENLFHNWAKINMFKLETNVKICKCTWSCRLVPYLYWPGVGSYCPYLMIMTCLATSQLRQVFQIRYAEKLTVNCGYRFMMIQNFNHLHTGFHSVQERTATLFQRLTEFRKTDRVTNVLW